MQQQVHHAKAVRIGDELRADESIMSLKESLWFSQLVEIVGVSLDVVIGTDEKTGCSCRRIMHYLAGLRLHQTDDAIDQRAGREILPCPRLFVRRVLFEQSLVEIAQAFFTSRKPVQLVNARCESL